MKRRICSVFLALAMMVSLMAFPVSAEESESAYDWSGESTAISEENGVITITGDGTLTLTADVTATVYVTGGTVAIDLGGYTLTQGSTTTSAAPYTSTIYVAIDANVTITGDGTVQNTYNAEANTAGSACVFNNGTCTIESGTYKTVSSAGKAWYTILNHGTMTINGGSFSNEASSSNSALVENGYQSYTNASELKGYVSGVNQNAPSMTINGGTFVSTGSCCVKCDDNAVLVINDGTFSGTVTAITNANITTINGGTFTVTVEGQSVISNSWSSDDYDKGQLTINGGTFTGTYIFRTTSTSSTSGVTTIYGGTFNGTLISASYASLITSDKVLIYGGTFTDDVSAYRIKYTWSGSGNDISEADGIITISGDGTLTLIYDTTATVHVTSGTVTIDLGGCTLTQGGTTTSAAPYTSTIYVALGAAVTITGNGTVLNTYNAETNTAGSACVFNNGTCTIENGTYQTVSSADEAWYTIINHGTMTINGGSFSNEAAGSDSSLIENGYYNYTSSSHLTGYVEGVNAQYPTLTINGGTFSSTGTNAVKNDDGGVMTINDGTFNGAAGGSAGSVILNYNYGTINGGTFTALNSNTKVISNGGYGTDSIDACELTITGGVFTAYESTALFGAGSGSSYKGTVTITGGTFTGEIPTISKYTLTVIHGTFTDDAVSDYLASSYTATDEDGNVISAFVILIDGEVHALVKVDAAESDCTTDGNAEYYICVYDDCGTVYTASAETDEDGNETVTYTKTTLDDVTVKASHTYGEPEWTWTATDDGYAATAVFTCSVCGETEEAEATVKLTGKVVGSCTQDGVYTYTATVELDGTTYTGTYSYTYYVSPGSHDYQVNSVSWASDYSYVYVSVKCTVCSTSKTLYTKTGITSETVEATCTEDGYTIYTATVSKDGVGEFTVTETVVTEEATGHSYEAVVTEPTCTEGGYTTYTCTVCGDTYTADETEALGHSYEAVVTEPTCTEGGYTTYTCTVCGDTYTADETEALGHSYEAVVTEPTCTEGGYTTYTCTVCGDTYTADETEALGHIYDPVGKTPNGHTVFACEICGDTYESDEIVSHVHSFVGVVTEPTCTEGGYTTYTCSICGKHFVSNKTDALGHSYDEGTVTTPATETSEGVMTYTCTVCGDTYTEAIPMIEAETEPEADTDTETGSCPLDETCPIYPYTDTDMTLWYHDAVHYVIENGIMIGTGDTTWEPDTAITRAMIVTILYRLEGSPDVEGTSAFSDVISGSWYEDAVIWAEQNGILEGYGDGTCGPNDTLTREQFAAIMYRYSAYKGYDVSASADLSVYPDADEVSTWAESAMSWAVGSGLITGTLEGGVTYLAPASDTTRAQGAQIIYRYLLALVG